jgi:hypothetical protein
MTDELYPGYDPMIDPNPVTCWGMPDAQEMEESNRRQRFGFGMTTISKANYCGRRSLPQVNKASATA